MFGFLKKVFGTAQDRLIRRYRKVVPVIQQWDEKFQALSDAQLKHKTIEFRERLAKGESLDDLLPEAFAVVKNCARRLTGAEVHVSGYDQRWDMVPYDVQLMGGMGMHSGSIVEMMTGEGKTLTAVLPLYLNALSGKPVHLVTVNDYLAERDCQWVGTILRWLGLTTGVVTGDTPIEKRKEVYAADVVYGTASEFGFDYLRDNSMAQTADMLVQRGFFFAIIDEADSILIDEARTPLIISGPVPVSRQMYDELKGGVSELVRQQRELCSKLASDAKKVLDNASTSEKEKEEALRRLWLVSKGTPQNKILKRIKEDPDLRKGIDDWDLYYYSDSNKEEKAEALAELYVIIDEKGNEFELTDKGIAGWHQATNGVGQSEDFVMLDISHEYNLVDGDPELTDAQKVEKRLQVQEEDAQRKERAHNLRQLLRAQLMMEKDVDYIIADGKIVIIDENTGRPQPGRRFSDGLHQAIEAKEGLAVQKETQTYATITLQNYFRMYDKIAGMTGTASTEANELKQIYKLDVLELPPHRPNKRKDSNDEIYMTEREKYNALLKEVQKEHAKGRPILIGTESVEVSEKLARIFKLSKLEHVVLNAKQNDKEAEIVANAGRRGAITIATNMAGRGTDIKLETGIADLGGLHVIGSTRHQSRRIDRQLRGRCARQGDPGSSIFYISFEDTLLRLFASPRLTTVLQRFRPPEGEPISAKMLNKSIETAQKRIEQRNYTIRKHTLEYDDVMNLQRQEIYAFRNELLKSTDIKAVALHVIDDVIRIGTERYFVSRSQEDMWDAESFRQWLMTIFPLSFKENVFDNDHAGQEDLEKQASEMVVEAFLSKMERETQKVDTIQTSGLRFTGNPLEENLRRIMLFNVDKHWQEHLLAMDHLRADVNLRTVGKSDPLTEFKHEAFRLFHELSLNLRSDIAQQLFKFELMLPEPQQLQEILQKLQMEKNRSLVNELEAAQASTQAPPPPESEMVPEPVSVGPKVGRNDDCPCGSGKKYKKCHGQE